MSEEKIEVGILGYVWKVIFVNDKSPNLVSPLKEDCYLGVCHNLDYTIYIDKTMNKNTLRQTMLHELTHAYLGSVLHNEEKYDQEFICNFVGKYADQIVSSANYVIEMYESYTTDISKDDNGLKRVRI